MKERVKWMPFLMEHPTYQTRVKDWGNCNVCVVMTLLVAMETWLEVQNFKNPELRDSNLKACSILTKYLQFQI